MLMKSLNLPVECSKSSQGPFETGSRCRLNIVAGFALSMRLLQWSNGLEELHFHSFEWFRSYWFVGTVAEIVATGSRMSAGTAEAWKSAAAAASWRPAEDSTACRTADIVSADERRIVELAKLVVIDSTSNSPGNVLGSVDSAANWHSYVDYYNHHKMALHHHQARPPARMIWFYQTLA